jgi:hypothetical protein
MQKSLRCADASSRLRWQSGGFDLGAEPSGLGVAADSLIEQDEVVELDGKLRVLGTKRLLGVPAPHLAQQLAVDRQWLKERPLPRSKAEALLSAPASNTRFPPTASRPAASPFRPPRRGGPCASDPAHAGGPARGRDRHRPARACQHGACVAGSVRQRRGGGAQAPQAFRSTEPDRGRSGSSGLDDPGRG